MLWRGTSVISPRGPVAPLARAGRVPGPAGAAAPAAVPVPAVTLPPAILPPAPDAARATVQPPPAAAALLAAAAARAASAGRRPVPEQGAQVRPVRAAGAGLGVRAGGAARAQPELVAGAAAGRLAARARRVRGPPARRAHLDDVQHAARLRPQEHRTHGQRAGRRNSGLTRDVALYIACIYIAASRSEVT